MWKNIIDGTKNDGESEKEKKNSSKANRKKIIQKRLKGSFFMGYP